ncbi:hypothetical protein IAQ61_004229 [Plenodomus lingam]|uniref:Predicted protein n=1 Tax=Leptosphaeria maculans (strain JN3 / isolate v23.1.3 / race Av1-4-5-6-7-8) TaxID=985895 RepID=E4ZXJ3_LEPMJ|nr:predicted protein [Plenodomus lingam JN3]KAH9873605.1 hypothetical protein IAQ61_004229 [Plenodomus lingam]CBX95403.1 predicted protein [Plenodomus lingam JN3]
MTARKPPTVTRRSIRQAAKHMAPSAQSEPPTSNDGQRESSMDQDIERGGGVRSKEQGSAIESNLGSGT